MHVLTVFVLMNSKLWAPKLGVQHHLQCSLYNAYNVLYIMHIKIIVTVTKVLDICMFRQLMIQNNEPLTYNMC